MLRCILALALVSFLSLVPALVPVAVVSTDYKLCSRILPERVALLLAFHHIGVLLLRSALHVFFPAYVAWYSNRHPLDPSSEKVSGGL